MDKIKTCLQKDRRPCICLQIERSDIVFRFLLSLLKKKPEPQPKVLTEEEKKAQYEEYLNGILDPRD